MFKGASYKLERARHCLDNLDLPPKDGTSFNVRLEIQ
jgi:hypothetical protein